MVNHRLFTIGLVLLFLGIQLRLVKTFELNEPASQFIEQRLPSETSPTDTSFASYKGYDDYWTNGASADSSPSLRSVSPPRWIGWSLITVGAILVLTHPCFKT